MKAGESGGPVICLVCKRKKGTAIPEQKEAGRTCGNKGCMFDKEIKQALGEKHKIRILAPKTLGRIKILPTIRKK